MPSGPRRRSSLSVFRPPLPFPSSASPSPVLLPLPLLLPIVLPPLSSTSLPRRPRVSGASFRSESRRGRRRGRPRRLGQTKKKRRRKAPTPPPTAAAADFRSPLQGRFRLRFAPPRPPSTWLPACEESSWAPPRGGLARSRRRAGAGGVTAAASDTEGGEEREADFRPSPGGRRRCRRCLCCRRSSRGRSRRFVPLPLLGGARPSTYFFRVFSFAILLESAREKKNGHVKGEPRSG